MTNPAPTDWMTIQDLIKDTGMSRAAAYGAASTNNLPVPVYRFGGRYMISRPAWEALKTQIHPTQSASTTQAHSAQGNGA